MKEEKYVYASMHIIFIARGLLINIVAKYKRGKNARACARANSYGIFCMLYRYGTL